MLMKRCINCNEVIPKQRLLALPTSNYCIQCSNVDKVSAIPVIHHKTGNEIQIIADKSVADEFHRLSSRVGFGTLRGLKAGKSGGTEHKVKTKQVSHIIVQKDDEESMNKVGEKAMYYLDLLGYERAKRYVEDNVTSRYISKVQGSRILNILRSIQNVNNGII